MAFGELGETCGGSGWLNCECGGDICVCELNGGCQCFGCPDCEGRDEDEYDDEYEDGF